MGRVSDIHIAVSEAIGAELESNPTQSQARLIVGATARLTAEHGIALRTWFQDQVVTRLLAVEAEKEIKDDGE